MPIFEHIGNFPSFDDLDTNETDAIEQINDMIDVINDFHLQKESWLENKIKHQSNICQEARLLLQLVKVGFKADAVVTEIVTCKHSEFFGFFVEQFGHEKELSELNQKVESYAHFLSYSAVELAILSKLIEKLALAVFVVKSNLKNSDPVTVQIAKDLELFTKNIHVVREKIALCMNHFLEANQEHREKVLANLRASQSGKATPFTFDVVLFNGKHPVRLNGNHYLPDHIDLLYALKKELCKYSQEAIALVEDKALAELLQHSSESFKVEYTLMQDQSIAEDMPDSFSSDNTVKNYFRDYIQAVKNKSHDEKIIEESQNAAKKDNEPLMFELTLEEETNYLATIMTNFELQRQRASRFLCALWNREFEQTFKRCEVIDLDKSQKVVIESSADSASTSENEGDSYSNATYTPPRIDVNLELLNNKHENDILDAIPAESAEETGYMNALKDEIQLLLGELNKNITSSKNQGGLWEFFSPIARKTAKRDALQELLAAPTLGKLIELAESKLHDPIVTKCTLYSNTASLLTKIVACKNLLQSNCATPKNN